MHSITTALQYFNVQYPHTTSKLVFVIPLVIGIFLATHSSELHSLASHHHKVIFVDDNPLIYSHFRLHNNVQLN